MLVRTPSIRISALESSSCPSASSAAHTRPFDSTQLRPRSMSRHVAMSLAPPIVRLVPSVYLILIFIFGFLFWFLSSAVFAFDGRTFFHLRKDEKKNFREVRK